MGTINNLCDKSGTSIEDLPVMVEADLKPDGYGHLIGTAARFKCPGCGRNIGPDAGHRLAPHSFKDPGRR